MGFANQNNEWMRLALLTALVVCIELFVMPTVMFKLLIVSGSWTVIWQIAVIVVPRFVVMLFLVLLLEPFSTAIRVGCFFVSYLVILLVRFYYAEVFVEWSDAIAASRATLPYISGLVGAALGAWIRWK